MPQYVLQNRLRELMAEKGRREGRTITQTALAEETGLARYTVDKWARNENIRMDDKTIITFCRYFGCKPGDLIVMVEVSEEDPADQGQSKTPLRESDKIPA